jgi:hypothetical protein
MRKKFVSVGALVATVVLAGVFGQVPSAASTARPQAPRVSASCDGDSVPAGYPYYYQTYQYPNECYACQLAKADLGPSIPTFCELVINDFITAQLWYGNHLG